MLDCQDRVVEDHPWTAIAHDGANPLPHLLFIAVHRTAAAEGLRLHEGAAVNPLIRILQDLVT